MAARRFAEGGVDAVGLEAVAEEADVARGTLYSHFATKDALVEAILAPLIEEATAALASARPRGARRRVEALLGVYRELWQRHPDALRLSYKLQDRNLRGLGRAHGAFMAEVLAALEPAASRGLLRVGSAAVAARTLARTAVPLLELYDGLPDGERVFAEAMLGLLLVDEGAARGARGSKAAS